MSNKAEIEKFRKQLKEMLGEIGEVDKKVLNKSVNAGLRYAKQNTPVGVYPSNVSFTTKDGKDVSFSVSPKQGGHLRKSWSTNPIQVTSDGVEKEIINTADYALYWDAGHRIVNTAGETTGFVEGSHLLDKVIEKVEKIQVSEFEKEMRRISDKYD